MGSLLHHAGSFEVARGLCSTSVVPALELSGCSTWTLDKTVPTSSSYKDYTVELSSPSKYVKLDVAGTQQVRIAKMTFTLVEDVATNCDHASLSCGETCPECDEYTKEHKYSNNCVASCENGCGTATGPSGTRTQYRPVMSREL